MKNLRIDNSETTLVLKDVNNLEWHLSEPVLRRRLGIQQRYGRPGGYVTGDREISTRNLNLKSTLTAMQDSDYLYRINQQLVRIFDQSKSPFYLVDLDNSRRCEIELASIAPNASDGLEMISVGVSIDLMMIESLWEDLTATETVSLSGGSASGDTLLCDNTGSVNSYPVITVGVILTNPEFTIYNDTTGDLITISSTAFTTGLTIEIDCINGTLNLIDGTTSTEISSAIADGTGFLYLAPGENTLRYESSYGAADITIAWRNKDVF